MKHGIILFLVSVIMIFMNACSHPNSKSKEITAADILGNPENLAFSYGGYRQNTRDVVPTVGEIKDDMKILSAMGVKFLRTYNTKQYAHAENLLKAIRELKNEDPDFEMYIMLGTWIECEGAWTNNVNHKDGNIENNTAEITAAIEMANEYPDIVKVIAVGNEAMVQWAISYYVTPNVILKWVNHLQELKRLGDVPSDIWITSSDNYESWGGGNKNYHTDDLTALIKAVDYISLHTYPFHDSHYNPEFWGVPSEEENFSAIEKMDAAMLRSKEYAISQYQSSADYIASLGIEKDIHIGETGWASIASSSYGATGSKAADEYKENLYYRHMRDWTKEAGMSCFYFEAFDEKWKDQGSALGSENHFGLINLDGQAKYALWDLVDEGVFDGLTRNGNPISKTYNGNIVAMMADVLVPPLTSEMKILEITTTNENREAGEKVTEEIYIVSNNSLVPGISNSMTYPSSILKLNAWEGTCGIEMSKDGIIEVVTGTGTWWGCALEMKTGKGEDMSNFKDGYLNFEMKGNTSSSFTLGFQCGSFAQEKQVNNYVNFGSSKSYDISDEWKTWSIPITELNKGANLKDVSTLLFLIGDKHFDGKKVNIKNIYYSKN